MKPYPERRAQGQRAVQGRPEEAGQPGARARLRAAVPGGDHRVHRHRQHDDAVDLRAHEGDRLAARRRRQPPAGALDGALGGGDHRVVRNAPRHRAWRCSSVGPWSTRCTTRASRSSRPRRVVARHHRRDHRRRRRWSGRVSRPGARPSSTCCARSSRSSAPQQCSGQDCARSLASLSRTCLRRDRPGSGSSRRGASRRRCRGCAPRAARRCGRCRSRRWPPGCRPASGRSTAASRALRAASSGTGTPITGSGVIDAVMPGQVGGTARAGDDHLEPAVGRRPGVLDHVVGCAVGRDDADLVRHAELDEHVDRALHHRQVGIAAHDHPNARVAHAVDPNGHLPDAHTTHRDAGHRTPRHARRNGRRVLPPRRRRGLRRRRLRHARRGDDVVGATRRRDARRARAHRRSRSASTCSRRCPSAWSTTRTRSSRAVRRCSSPGSVFRAT